MKRTLLSVKELAVALGISELSVRRAYLKGEIPGARICRMLRFDLRRVLKVVHSRGLSHALKQGAVRVGARRDGAGSSAMCGTVRSASGGLWTDCQSQFSHSREGARWRVRCKCLKIGGPCRGRTYGPLIKSQLLYQLS